MLSTRFRWKKKNFQNAQLQQAIDLLNQVFMKTQQAELSLDQCKIQEFFNSVENSYVMLTLSNSKNNLELYNNTMVALGIRPTSTSITFCKVIIAWFSWVSVNPWLNSFFFWLVLLGNYLPTFKQKNLMFPPP